MKSPYMNALNRPSTGLADCFMKKEMVMGTIGNTQGVSSMAKPQRIASMISPHRLFEPVPELPAPVPEPVEGVERASGLPLSRGTLNSKCSGAAQNWSLQPLQVSSPLTVALPSSSFILWEKTAESKKTFSFLNMTGSVTCTRLPAGA